MNVRGGYQTFTGSSMPHPNERIGPNVPMWEIPRVAPRYPEVIPVMEPLPGFPGGARRVMTDR